MANPKRWYRRFFGIETEAERAERARAVDAQRSRGYRLSAAGIELAGGVLLFAGLGWLADRGLGTAPWLLVTGAILGLIGGLYLLIKAASES